MMLHTETLKDKDTYFQQLAVLGGAKEKPKKERVRGGQRREGRGQGEGSRCSKSHPFHWTYRRGVN